jgi:hypothetical protein
VKRRISRLSYVPSGSNTNTKIKRRRRRRRKPILAELHVYVSIPTF